MRSSRQWTTSVIAVVLLCALVEVSCGTIRGFFDRFDTTNMEILNALNDAITALQGQSADWQKVLRDAQDKLTKDAQSTIRNEIATVVSRSIAQAGVELRCDADFVKDRVREQIVMIKAKFLHQSVPVAVPSFCQVTPVAVDRVLVPDRLKQLEFYGYNFTDAPGLSVFLIGANGSRQDVTRYLDRPTHYAMTLRFGGNGVLLGDFDDRFVLEWGGKEISSISIIQPLTPICQSNVQPVFAGALGPEIGPFVPPKVGSGDNDFNGNGPDVWVDVSMITTPASLTARVHMRALETRSDWTEVDGWQDFTLYSPPSGWKLDHLLGKASTSYYFRASGTVPQSFQLGPAEPVRRFWIVADTMGDEAGTTTSVKVMFNQLQVVLTQTSNCVPDHAFRLALMAKMVSPQAIMRLHTGALTQLKQRNTDLSLRHLDHLVVQP